MFPLVVPPFTPHSSLFSVLFILTLKIFVLDISSFIHRLNMSQFRFQSALSICAFVVRIFG